MWNQRLDLYDVLCQKEIVFFMSINRPIVFNYAYGGHISNMKIKEIQKIKESKLTILNFIH